MYRMKLRYLKQCFLFSTQTRVSKSVICFLYVSDDTHFVDILDKTQYKLEIFRTNIFISALTSRVKIQYSEIPNLGSVLLRI